MKTDFDTCIEVGISEEVLVRKRCAQTSIALVVDLSA